MNIEKLKSLPVGARIYFSEEKQPYRVRARSDRYLVCTKPFNPRRTTLYCIIDLVENIRGTENLVFGMGAETDDDCNEMIDRLEGRGQKTSAEDLAKIRKKIPDFNPEPICKTEVSHRNRLALHVERIVI